MPKTRIAYVDRKVQYGRGRAAAVLGQTYDVHRLDNTTNNSIITGSPVLSSFPAYLDKAKRGDLENVIFDLLAVQMTCDNSKLRLGDILVETGYESNAGQYAFAQRRPLKPSIFIRVERNVNITRPNPLAGQAGEQPTSGSVVATDYIGVTQASELYLTLTNGQYNFASAGLMASVPFGLQPQNRIRGPHKPDFPTQVEETQFLGYLPALPGVQILENDVVNSDAGDRYRVAQPYQSDDVGLVGSVLILKKIMV